MVQNYTRTHIDRRMRTSLYMCRIRLVLSFLGVSEIVYADRWTDEPTDAHPNWFYVAP